MSSVFCSCRGDILRCALIVLFGIINSSLWCQQTELPLLKGKLVNAKAEAIPWASLFLKNAKTGVATNENGQFEFPVPQESINDTIVIHALGYKTFADKVTNLLGRQTIMLIDTIYALQEIEVSVLTAEEIIQKTMQTWETNFPMFSYTFESFYRSTQKEDGKYARLIEAHITGFDKGYQYRKKSDVTVRIDQARYSNDYRDKRTQWLVAFFKPEFIYTTENLSRDKQRIKTELDAGNYVVSMDTILLLDNKPVYVVNALSKENVKRLMFSIRFYIRTDDFAIVQMDFDAQSHIQYLTPSGIPGSLLLKPTAYKGTCVFREVNDYMFMHYVNLNAAFDWTDPKTKQILEHEETSEAIIQNIAIVKKSESNIKPLKNTKYYGDASFRVPLLPYDTSFWNSNEMQLQIPYGIALKGDLEREMSLEEQFKRNARK